jgi:hypothetical protein
MAIPAMVLSVLLIIYLAVFGKQEEKAMVIEE